MPPQKETVWELNVLSAYLEERPSFQGPLSILWLERVLAAKSTEVQAIKAVEATDGQLQPVEAFALIDRAFVVGIEGVGEDGLVTPAD